MIIIRVISCVRILHPSNVDKEKLMEYAVKAAQFATAAKSRQLPHTDWSMLPRGPPPGTPDVCIFDFTNLYAARVAARSENIPVKIFGAACKNI